MSVKWEKGERSPLFSSSPQVILFYVARRSRKGDTGILGCSAALRSLGVTDWV
jgi:hypothetical protein